MNDLVPTDGKAIAAFDRILAFYEPESTVVLTAEEEQILKRWVHADKLLSLRKFKTAQIIEQLIELFGISKYTAQNDIKQAYALFGQTRVISKQYVLYHHIENLQLLIQQYSTDKSLSHLIPKLADALTKALAQLPDEIAKQKSLPTTVVLQVGNGQVQSQFSFEEAQRRREALKKQREADEYIDFEDK